MINRISKTTQVEYYVLNLIAKENFAPGQQLPPEIKLAQKTGSSVITVRRALAELVKQNIIERFQGKGTFVKKNKAAPAPMGTIAFLLVNRTLALYESLIEEVRQTAGQRCHDLVVITTNELPDSNLTSRLAGVSAVVMSGAVRDEWVEFLELMHIPFVVIGTYKLNQPVWNVRYDYAQAALLGVKRLYAHGCRAIGLINGAQTWPPAVETNLGYRRALKELGLPDQDCRVVWYRKQTRLSELREFLSSCNGKTDGFLMESSWFTPFQALFYESELISPRPLLCLIGQLPFLSEPTQKIFSVSFQEGLGASAVDLLFTAATAGQEEPRNIMIPPVP